MNARFSWCSAMIMRRCNKAFDERRWRVLLCLLLLLLLFVLGAILDGKLFNTASRRQSPTSSISLRAHAPLWTASEGEAIYQAGNPEVYIQRCG